MNTDEGRKGGRQGERLGRRLSEDETKLWHGVTKSVAPLRKRTAAKPKNDYHPSVAETSKAAPKAPSKKSVSHAALPAAITKPKPPPPALAPLDRKTRSRIARGTRDIDARIDLHGHTQAEAHDALVRFLRRARDKGASVVLVITGKGTRGDGVLKRQVPMWLSLPEFRDLVVGFDDAAISHGGEGALYVRVRKKR
jgi:DNA-nicking Smr family endonuclease